MSESERATERLAILHFHGPDESCPNRKDFSDYRESGSCVGHEVAGAFDLALRLAEAVMAQNPLYFKGAVQAELAANWAKVNELAREFQRVANSKDESEVKS